MTYLIHSAKGTTWENHKYIRKEGDRYIYKEGTTRKKDQGAVEAEKYEEQNSKWGMHSATNARTANKRQKLVAEGGKGVKKGSATGMKYYTYEITGSDGKKRTYQYKGQRQLGYDIKNAKQAAQKKAWAKAVKKEQKWQKGYRTGEAIKKVASSGAKYVSNAVSSGAKATKEAASKGINYLQGALNKFTKKK